jgi:ceramidase
MSSGIAKAAIATVPLLLVLWVIAAWNPRGEFWSGVEPPKAQGEAWDPARLAAARTLDSSIYDPAKLCRLIREPQNTVSNLAYAFVGLALGFSCRRRLSRSLAAACLFLALGSGLYHASLLAEWRLLDILGVYVVLFSLLSVGLAAALRRAFSEFGLAAGIWIFAFYAGIHRNEVRIVGFKIFDSTYVVAACVAAGVALALLSLRHIADDRSYVRRALVLAAAALGAFFGGLTDRFGEVWANPGAIVQGHAVWHTLGAVALLAAYEIFALTGYDRSVFTSLPGVDPRSGPALSAIGLPRQP